MSGFTVTYRARDARGHAITLRKNLATLVEAADFALGLPDKYWSAPRVEMAR